MPPTYPLVKKIVAYMNEYRVTFASSGSQKSAPYPNFEKAVETFPVSRLCFSILILK